ncbi:phage terminase large subunit [Streptosporangium sp. NBC_01755]|uniref:phage terminase large subunit n=1 Tax=Streptosporangium sp. NBC_01755 TaxID=2975949 RepID=UPI002DDA21A5|nr:phage terminase large subunit [Streptosporangium sp. NBC_01755]WSD03253.1 phage terminase large subunit [Streptosporangium sp. NBC_01755]
MPQAEWAVMTVALRHVYRPRGAARQIMECRASEVLLSGPAGTGKSRAAMEKLHLMMLLNPGARGLIVRKTLASLGSTGLVTWREHVAKESITAGHVVWYGGSPQEAAAYRYSNGSTIVVGGLDKAQKVMSSEYDVIFVQEAIELTVDDWEALTTRLRNGKISFQQLLADCNPSTPTHWLKARADRGDTVMLHSRHEDNPVLFRPDGTLTMVGRDYIGKLDKLTGVRHHRLRHGRWVAAEGLIYEEWDPAVHLLDRFPIPDSWTRWWSVDFGYTNPFVLQCWAEDPDGRLYLYREIYFTRRLVEDHAKHILRLVAPGGKWREPRPRAIVCDHDAEDRATLERHLGMSTVAAKKTVSDGIQAVQSRLKVAGDGRPRLFILRDSVVERDPELEEAKKPACTAEEIVGYVWDNKDGKQPKEVPVKENDHGCDGKRYVVAERDLGSRPRIRVL